MEVDVEREEEGRSVYCGGVLKMFLCIFGIVVFRLGGAQARARETRHVSMHCKFRVSHVLESVLLFA